MRTILDFISRLFSNWITLLGAGLATLAGSLLVTATLLEAISTRSNPYLRGFLILSLPLIFLLGLGLIPIGLYVQRRYERALMARGLTPESSLFGRAFYLLASDSRSRRLILFVGFLTAVNILLLFVGGHQAVRYMDSPLFCGTSCHTQMQPEWTAYKRSAHNQVACVECHIAPGTTALVEAKLQGLSQLFSTLTGTYHRPIPAFKVHRGEIASTCEGCHDRSRFTGERVRIYPHYKPDKDNTPAFNMMLLHVGGSVGSPPFPGGGPAGPAVKYIGIHAHMAPDHLVRYEYFDKERTRIGKITVLKEGKLTAEYKLPDAGPSEKPLGERVMDCTDCHNRPAHRFDGTVRQAVERAVFAGRLDAKQPYVVKVAMAVLSQATVSREEAPAYFKKAVPAAYASVDKVPSAAELDLVSADITRIYLRNVFPAMNIRWNTYPDLAGHYAEGDEQHVGCLRCHDGKHQARLADGRSKTMDKSCDLCHDALATEKSPDKFEDLLKQVVGLPLD